MNQIDNQVEHIILQDEKEHTEDELIIVNRVVDGKFVPIRWSDLQEWERRAAQVQMFNPNGIA